MSSVSRSERPYVICHICTSIDARISGQFMAAPASIAAVGAYRRLQKRLFTDAIAYGSTTARAFAGGRAPALEASAGEDVPGDEVLRDFVAVETARRYCIVLDPAGEVGWAQGPLHKIAGEDVHVIEVLCRSTPAAYRSYLRDRSVSYIIAGHESIDLPRALAKLKELFGIERVLLCGGGATDMAFLADGLIDELSLVIAPVVSGEDTVTSFDESPFARGGAFPFALSEAVKLEGGGVHLRYVRMEPEA